LLAVSHIVTNAGVDVHPHDHFCSISSCASANVAPCIVDGTGKFRNDRTFM